MKSLAPWFVAIGAAIIAVTSALGGARGAFIGRVPLTPYLYSYGVALLAFGVAGVLYYRIDEVPKVIPLRYDAGPNSPRQNQMGQWCRPDGTIMSVSEVLRAKHWVNRLGIIFDNQGDPAFEISPRNHVPVGPSLLIFDGQFSNWKQTDGEGFFPVNMERPNKSGLLGGLFEERVEHQIASVPITIRYRNNKGHRYRTTCNIERDAQAPHGLSVSRVRVGRDLLGFLRRGN